MPPKKKRTIQPILRSGKCDVIESILLARDPRFALNPTMEAEEHSPKKMIARMERIITNSEDARVKSQASKAIELLQELRRCITVSEADRRRINQAVHQLGLKISYKKIPPFPGGIFR